MAMIKGSQDAGSSADSAGAERLSVRISSSTREVIDRIKVQFGLTSDADVIRHALGTQGRIGESIAKNERIFVGSAEGELLKELVFVPPRR